MPFISWSIAREDMLLLRALKDVNHADGFYIDVGSNHPTYGSDTRLFYEHGWRGMNIEPSPTWFAKLLDERPDEINIHAAASDKNGTITLYDDAGGGLGTTREDFADRHVVEFDIAKRAVEVPAVTLASLCEEHVGDRTIHFLKIDVEGHEESVIRGMDFKRFRPWILCIEATEPLKVHIPTHQDWDHLVIAAGYKFALFDGLNRWYVAEERPERMQAFNHPVDDYVYWNYVHQIALLENRVRELECECLLLAS